MGIVLIELATGKYPFGEARSIIDMVQTVAEADPPTLPDDGKEEKRRWVDESVHGKCSYGTSVQDRV